MSKSPRPGDFLADIVSEALVGRGEWLSERAVGRSVLGRADTFDGRFGASVRVCAGRLRKSLEEYYSAEGWADRLRIELPTGAHVPRFVRSAPTELPARAKDTVDDSTVVVLPFAAVGDVRADLVATTISEVIVHRLATFPGLRVIGPATARSQDPRLIGRELGGRFVLQGSLGFRDGLVRLSARLTDATRGDLVWAGSETVEAGRCAGSRWRSIGLPASRLRSATTPEWSTAARRRGPQCRWIPGVCGEAGLPGLHRGGHPRDPSGCRRRARRSHGRRYPVASHPGHAWKHPRRARRLRDVHGP